MNYIFSSTLFAFLINCIVESESNGSTLSSALSSKETLVVKNTTQDFVRKILKQYSSHNDSTQIAVNEFYSLLKALRIGEVYDVTTASGAPKSVDNQMQGRGKDSMISKTLLLNTNNTATHRQEGHKNCIGKDKLLQLHHVNKTDGINMDDFILLCPSLVYEVQSGACLHIEQTKIEQTEMTLEAWLYGLLSITVISLSSLFAIAIIPCLGKAIYNKVMSFLVALAVGTLAGDAFLHLIPHAFLKGVQIENQEGQVNPVWKGVVIMAGIYVFLMVEMLMKLRVAKRGEKQENEKESQDDLPNEEFHQSVPCKILVDAVQPILNHNHCVHSHSDAGSRDTGLDSPSSTNETEVLSDLSHSDGIAYSNTKSEQWKMPLYSTDEPGESKGSYNENALGVIINRRFTECKGSCHDVQQCSEESKPSEDSEIDLDPLEKSEETDAHHHHHHHHHHGNKEIGVSTPIATVAWMVIVGDGFHNFSDGLAVGAAFSSSITNGLTTAIAVLCHELPHELGDFAVLIKSGISFKQAVVYNLASAVISYLGLIVGLGIGNLDTSHVWVLALTSGLFLYISLVGMLPELSSYQAKGRGYSIFLLQNAGILTGIVIMLIIALLEQH